VRFYQRRGLLPEHRTGRLRRHPPLRPRIDAERGCRFVKAAQRLGFSLDDIEQLLKLEDGTHCSQAAELAALRLDDVRAKLSDLSRIEAALSKLVGECHAHQGNVSCPLIAALHCR
jgi:MerR family mercuric resistance operon transcriptional regulator